MTNTGVPRKSKGAERIGTDKPPTIKPALKKHWEKFFAVNLRPYCNMIFKDKVKEDKKGGWTDQGENDMRNIPLGDLLMNNTPFKIIDPDDTIDVEAQRSCIVLGDNKFRPYFPKVSRGILVGEKAKQLFFLHCSAWGVREENVELGSYTVKYEDGSEEVISIRNLKNIGSWWSPGGIPEADTAWIGSNPVRGRIGIYKYKWVNPHPEKKITSINMESNGKAVLILVAITGSR